MTPTEDIRLQQEREGVIRCSAWLGRIICGDNSEVLSAFPDACIDLVVTSPPYGDLRTYGGQSWNFQSLALQLVRVLKPGGVVVWIVADQTTDADESGQSMEQALYFRSLGMKLHDTMIYVNDCCHWHPNSMRYRDDWEYMFVLSKGRARIFNGIRDKIIVKTAPRRVKSAHEADSEYRLYVPKGETTIRSNVWRVNAGSAQMDGGNGHPAVMPIRLAKDHIATWSNPGDVVLDPFAGSGTTCKAAKELERRWTGIEVNPDYCAIAEARVSQGVLQLEASYAP